MTHLDTPKTPVTPKPLTIAARLRAMTSAISLTELAAILGMGRNTIYTQARAGKIPTHKVGSTLRADPIEIADWWEACANAA